MSVPIWKQVPFIRVLLAFIAGIVLQWNLPFTFTIIAIGFGTITSIFLLYFFLPIHLKFKCRFLHSFFLILAIINAAQYFTWYANYKNHHDWYGNHLLKNDALLIKIDEPLVEKQKSFKSIGIVKGIIQKGNLIATNGKLLLYFKKEKDRINLHYGDLIVIKKKLQTIKNNGNPGSFDNIQYQSFQQIYQQVFLSSNEIIVIPYKDINPLFQFIFSLRSYTLSCLSKYINDEKNKGVAEALLIGYKNDLDKDLVSEYTNAGVVHIIAISGLHLGLIYMVLVWLFDRIPFVKKSKFLKSTIVLVCLWIFSLLTGASASVLRSALMFTCIVLGKLINKQSSIYNSLAASAFILLCYNPYYTWDVGFQLSYLAIIGIVWLQQPIKVLLFSRYFILRKIGEMSAITIAAQVITFPICLFYFHQFPNLFLLSNLIAVPVSTIILFEEIFLLCFSWLPYLGLSTGFCIDYSIQFLNSFIITINKIPFANWQNIHADIFSTMMLYVVIIGVCFLLLKQNKYFLKIALVGSLAFISCISIANWNVFNQNKMIVYNMPNQNIVDIISGNKCYTFSDKIINSDKKNADVLKPARLYYEALPKGNISVVPGNNNLLWQYHNKSILFVDTNIVYKKISPKIKVDFLIISQSPKIKMSQLLQSFAPSFIIFDGTNKMWKISKWKRECEALNLRCYSIPEQGAFVYNFK